MSFDELQNTEGWRLSGQWGFLGEFKRKSCTEATLREFYAFFPTQFTVRGLPFEKPHPLQGRSYVSVLPIRLQLHTGASKAVGCRRTQQSTCSGALSRNKARESLTFLCDFDISLEKEFLMVMQGVPKLRFHIFDLSFFLNYASSIQCFGFAR